MSARRKAGNDLRRKALKELIKKIEKMAKTDKAGAAKLLPAVYQVIDKSAQRGVIKKNNAARKKSRLMKLLK